MKLPVEANSSNPAIYRAFRCWVAGWGKTDFDAKFSFVQRKADLPIVDRTRCQNELSVALAKSNGPRSKNFELQEGEL